MIEMLGVLAIIGVLSVGGIAGYSKAMTKFKTNQVADQVSTIVTNIKTLYAQQKSYEGLNAETAVSMGIIPDELGTDYNNLTNPFNGEVRIWSSGSIDYKTFVIAYSGLSKEACLSLATNDWGNYNTLATLSVSSQKEYWMQNDFGEYTDNVFMNNSSYAHTGYSGDGYAIACPGGSIVSAPMSPQVAAEACACNEGNTCDVWWQYY